jgi:D-alanyl-D-alanine carboxypeptidase/D-alanyl-D-alanine-endopeptidase (penicillin-binding protein 4)
MWELVGSGVVSLWLETAGVELPGRDAVAILKWQAGLPELVVANTSEAALTLTAEEYLASLRAKGLLNLPTQGVWMQSEFAPLVSVAGTTPMPGASLTKIATSLASLDEWGPNHQFETLISATGPIENGVLRGDLVVSGGGDPFFVWQEAIALGVALNKLGIKRVTGNLIITGDFWMNYQLNPYVAGELLRQGLNSQLWSSGVRNLYFKMPPGTPEPQVAIAGFVISQNSVSNTKPLIRHQSLPLIYILKQLNVESDNDLAEILAGELLGGAKNIQQIAAWSAGVPQEEIQLINGSGLGEENRVSPRAASAMLRAIQRYLQTSKWNIADLFPVSGRDKGTLEERNIPKGAVVKTGTLYDTIALSGVLPTKEYGLVWFTLINRGTNWERLREEQDVFLQQIIQQLGAAPVPSSLSYHINGNRLGLGAKERNEVVFNK